MRNGTCCPWPCVLRRWGASRNGQNGNASLTDRDRAQRAAAGACDSEHTPDTVQPNDRTRVYRTYTEVCTQAYTKVQSTRRVGAAVAV